MLDQQHFIREFEGLSPEQRQQWLESAQRVNAAVADYSRRRREDQWIFEASEPDPRNMPAPSLRETVERAS